MTRLFSNTHILKGQRENLQFKNLKSKCPKNRKLEGLEAERACMNIDESQVLKGKLRKLGGGGGPLTFSVIAQHTGPICMLVSLGFFHFYKLYFYRVKCPGCKTFKHVPQRGPGCPFGGWELPQALYSCPSRKMIVQGCMQHPSTGNCVCVEDKEQHRI